MTKSLPRWLVVPCPESRHDELRTLLGSLEHPADLTVVVTTDRDTLKPHVAGGDAFRLVCVPWTGMRISEWWNAGLRHVAERYTPTDQWDVACVVSDVVGTPGSIDALCEPLRTCDVSMTGPDWHDRAIGKPLTLGISDVRDVWLRVAGTVFAVRGEEALRCDQSFSWWYTEDDLEMQARTLRGVALVPNTGFIHPPMHAEPADADVTRRDRVRYVTKWGSEPW